MRRNKRIKNKTLTQNGLWNQKALRIKTNANGFFSTSIVFSNLNERMAELSRCECKFKQFPNAFCCQEQKQKPILMCNSNFVLFCFQFQLMMINFCCCCWILAVFFLKLKCDFLGTERTNDLLRIKIKWEICVSKGETGWMWFVFLCLCVVLFRLYWWFCIFFASDEMNKMKKTVEFESKSYAIWTKEKRFSRIN